MRKNIAIIILMIGLIISMYFNYQFKGYKDNQKVDYTIKLNLGTQIGIKESIQNLDYVIKSLEDNSSKETVIYTLGNLAVSLKVGEESFIFLDSDFKEDQSSTDLIYSVFRDMYWYIRADITDDILSNKVSLEKESRNQLIQDIGVLKQDLEYIDSQFNEDVLKEQSPKWIENKWKELIGEIVNRNTDYKLYERMKMKYNL
ncbi:oxidoreductase [Paenibacillus taichungensis]|uniref:oxidoreductase n=1 Tax=Paenibacillus taichungensis TaxID=484184 RepID=UPI002DBA0681|nr:oxidoreductase [Paenibacillus taichungensis]MEC0106940.1 oxidoreductase [Paenibacillus taichungensis]MEC0195130.1 oxidoreductase [Paenibacillus taichungensis]